MTNDVFACLRDTGRGFVIGQAGQSLDGRVAGPNGERQFVNGPAGLDHLHRLRSMVDAVIVGVGTALTDDPQLTVRRVEGRNPARVVIDPDRRLPASARLFADDGARRVVIARAPGATPPGVEAIVIDRDDEIPPRAIIDALAVLGLRRLLVEGGTRTLKAFLAAGCLDRLHVLVAPVTLGAGPRSVVDSIEDFRVDGIAPAMRQHPLGDETLYDFDLRHDGTPSRHV